MSSTTEASTIALLLELERQRCQAITTGDWDGLAALLAPEFTYGFLSARIEDRTTYLAGLPSRPHGVGTSRHSVRCYDRAAVMTFEFTTWDRDTREELNAGTGLETWIRNDSGDWQLVASSTTRFGARSTHWSPPAG